MDVRNWAVLGSAAAAVVAGVYVLWGPSERRRKSRRDLCPGLQNHGSTCFLNAILQGLAPCTSIINWLGDFIDKRAGQKYTNYLAYTLVKTLKVLNNAGIEDADDPHSPAEVIHALRARRWVISQEEQDAHELFHVLTETLDEETTRFPGVVSLLDVNSTKESSSVKYQAKDAAVTRSQTELPVLPSRSQKDHPFRGLLASQLQCKLCKYQCPVRYDTFDSLSLSLPAHSWGPLTLDRLLKEYISSETVQNVECQGCAKKLQHVERHRTSSPPKTTYIKKMTIGKLPQCLCIHIQRTVWLNHGMPVKKCEHISFPELLNMAEYVYHTKKPKKPEPRSGLFGGKQGVNGILHNHAKVSQRPSLVGHKTGPLHLLKALNYQSKSTGNGILHHSSSPAPPLGSYVPDLNSVLQLESPEEQAARLEHKYKLTAAVVHLGDVFSGHFVTYRRVPSINGQRFPDKWLYTSDAQVKRASKSEVLRSDAYMLFYEKL